MPDEIIYAEDVNYWKTSKKTPAESWIKNAKREIENLGGKILEEGYAMREGKAAFLLSFRLEEQEYRMIWPVLKPQWSGSTEENAAKIQAATALYYEVKNTCVKAKFLGLRTAFLSYLTLDDGRTVSQLHNDEFDALLPEPYKATVIALPISKKNEDVENG